ncbi:hypothetical protein IAD21_02441 [Abditibacteriota bacterium]|nr:hypothetical protein IAD21_02441 [Abditibacteriota bacterium]
MNKLLLIGTLALLLFCPSFSWGQTNVPAPAEVPLVGGRILLDAKKSYARGEEVLLGITLENTGKRPLRFRYRDMEFFYDIDVTAGGKKIEPSLDFELPQTIGSFFTLAPQSKMKGYFYLSRAFDLFKEDVHTVTVSQKSRQPDVEGIFTITSQPFEFQVVGPPKFGYWEGYGPSSAPRPEITPVKQP